MLSILGIVAIVVFTIQVYKTAARTERNAPLWAIATAGIGIGIQFVLPVIIGMLLGIYYISSGTPVEELQAEIGGIASVIGVVGIVLSIVGMWLVMKRVSTVRDDFPNPTAPPPPPRFDSNI
ncbi:MAG TPA: DUF973 family protein [Pyrinomonadaceae bacterium]|nr:DUF973 family protein [Pyrinomonadaceae bacterium]